MFACTYVCVPCMCICVPGVLGNQKKLSYLLGLVMNSPCACWELNPGPPQDQQELLTTEPTGSTPVLRPGSLTLRTYILDVVWPTYKISGINVCHLHVCVLSLFLERNDP